MKSLDLKKEDCNTGKHNYTREGVNTTEVSFIQDATLFQVAEAVKKTLEAEYPGQDFVLEKSIKLRYSEKGTIIPDGGAIYTFIEGKKRFVAVSEKKYQKSDGGNAIERAWSNALIIADDFKDNNITGSIPYAIFCDGAAFVKGTCPRNKAEDTLASLKSLLHGKAPSLFMRGEEWSAQEMYDMLLSIARNTMSDLLNETCTKKPSWNTRLFFQNAKRRVCNALKNAVSW